MEYVLFCLKHKMYLKTIYERYIIVKQYNTNIVIK